MKKAMPRAEIITTGEEVLSGQILDSNAAWLAEFLIEHGFSVQRRTTVGDRLDDLVACFRERARHADIILVNGGLGPTVDDLSAEAAALACAVELVEYDAWVVALKTRFAAMNREMPARNLKQALLPQGADLIENRNGTACGFAVEIEGAVLYFTPGPPRELKPMMTEQILPRLRARFALDAGTKLKKLTTFGIAEARLDQMLADIPLPGGVSLGFRTQFPLIEIKIMGREAAADFDALVGPVAQAVRERVGANLIFEDGLGIAPLLLDLMSARGFTLALAESCTGGMIADQLVAIPNSSRFLERAYVPYSYRAKTEMIGVPMALIETKGAVSLEVARAMAAGALTTAKVSHALAVSGIAGPSGATPGKPVGTVAFALATQEQVYSQLLRLPNWGRTSIRQGSSMIALDMLRRDLVGLPMFGAFDYAQSDERDTTPLEAVRATLANPIRPNA